MSVLQANRCKALAGLLANDLLLSLNIYVSDMLDFKLENRCKVQHCYDHLTIASYLVA